MCVCVWFLVNEYRHRGHQNYERNFCFGKRHQTLDSIIYSDVALEVLLRVSSSWTVWRKTRDFSRSRIDGRWSLGTSQPSRVFSDATDQERRSCWLLAQRRGAQTRLPLALSLLTLISLALMYQTAGGATVALHLWGLRDFRVSCCSEGR